MSVLFDILEPKPDNESEIVMNSKLVQLVSRILGAIVVLGEPSIILFLPEPIQKYGQAVMAVLIVVGLIVGDRSAVKIAKERVNKGDLSSKAVQGAYLLRIKANQIEEAKRLLSPSKASPD